MNTKDAVDSMMEAVDRFHTDMCEGMVTSKWKCDELFILRTMDLGNGYQSTEIYQLNEAAQRIIVKQFTAAMKRDDCDEDDLFSCDFWDMLDAHKLIEFGD